MNISFPAVLNTVLFSSIAIVLADCMMDRVRRISGKAFRFVTFIILMIMLRLLIPFEIRGLQNNINLTGVYPKVYLFLTRPFLSLWGKEWSVLSVLMTIFLLGSIVCAVRFFLSYYAIFFTIKTYEPLRDETIIRLIKKINGELGYNVYFRVVQSREITTPYIFGLRKPVIVLPEAPLSEAEWYYILFHEMAHYYHKDLWVRFACEILHIVYWWNPFVYLLRRHLTDFQERHIDMVITQRLDESKRLDYLSCLIKVARLQPVAYRDNWVAEFNRRAELQGRIKRLLNGKEDMPEGRKHRGVNAFIVALLLIFTLLLPNFVILEPDGGIPDKILQNESFFLIHNDNSYLILNREGKYEVYVNNEYKATVTQIFDDTLPIYNTKGELIK